MVSLTELDPLRTILAVVAAHRDSDLLLEVALAAGLRFDTSLSERAAYSHKNRVREILPRILAAYATLSEPAALGAANALVAALVPHDAILEKASVAVRHIGWDIRNGELVVTEPDIREMFFPKGSRWDAFVVLRDVLAEASIELVIVDPYCDRAVFQLLADRAEKPLSVRILCRKYARSVANEARIFVAQHTGWVVYVRQAADFHDRFVVLNGSECVHIGASINHAGKTAFMISRVEDQANRDALLKHIEDSWSAAAEIP